MKQVVILGAGMAGFGAAYSLRKAGHRALIFDQNRYHGGHAASFAHEGGWIFDDGPHISFTRVERMQRLFAESVGQDYEVIRAYANNYWHGHWIKHPAQCNLYGLPTDLVVTILRDLIAAQNNGHADIQNYADWLVAAYGRTFAETFPMQYGRKFHTTVADNMTTDWLGPRLYRPSLDEVLYGALSPVTADVHYIDHFRYPTQGGFVSYLNMFLQQADVHLAHRLVRLDVRDKTLHFANGVVAGYDFLISSIPLPALIRLIPQAPVDVRDAASQLAWTQLILVNLGVDRDNISSAHWTYFYDDDFVFSRISFPHLLSHNTVPPGCGSIQAEIYFSDKYKPMGGKPDDYIRHVITDLKRCGILCDEDRILFREATVSRYAQVIFDFERLTALERVHGYLQDVGVSCCGRFGEWGYHWTDESFMSGERSAEEILGKIGSVAAMRN